MIPKYDNIIISKEEYAYFASLTAAEKVNYLFGIYDSVTAVQIDASQLTEFFTDITSQLTATETTPDAGAESDPDYFDANDKDRVDVMVDTDNILFESNSLTAMRRVINHFWESGFILSRDTQSEKMFRKEKLAKYMRIFAIVDKCNSVCLN